MRDGFLVVVVVVVVVVVKWGLGRSCGRIWLFQALLGAQFCGFCEYFSSPGNCVRKKHTKRKGESTIPTVFVVFGRVQK